MAERRSLIDGLKSPPVDPALAEAFVYGDKTHRKPKTDEPSDVTRPKDATARPIVEARVLISVRIRAELATRIKRLSLERQLAGIEPNRLQDISEDALETWLAAQKEPG